MYKKEIIIGTPEGLHARPAAQFVKKAVSYKNTDIVVSRDGKEVNAKSMLGVLSLGASMGVAVKIEATGEDEEAAVLSLTELLLK